MLCVCTRSCARADDVKIERSGDAQCNSEELPLNIIPSKVAEVYVRAY